MKRTEICPHKDKKDIFYLISPYKENRTKRGRPAVLELPSPNLQEECSGPAPSMPCGSKIVSAELMPHFDSPQETYVSNITYKVRH